MSTVLDAARGYAARGWAVTPTQGKKPILRRWQEQHLSGVELVGHFADGVNVGIVNGTLSGGLVDVDLDAREALAVADVFLPATGLVFGRPSKPQSHRIYIGDPLPTTAQFKDVDDPKTTLVELRSTGSQTVWPPSTHPEGEAITFDAQGEPTRIAGATLRTAVALLASCALLIRHWPQERGSRHDISNSLAGFLLRGGLEVTDVAKLIGTAARHAGDEQWRDRGGDVRATARAIEAGKYVTGGPTITTLLGDTVVSKLGDWLGLARRQEDKAFRSFLSSPSWPEAPGLDAYTGLAGDVVRMIEPHTEAAAVALLVQFLVAFGSVVGRGAHFVAEADRHFTNLFVAIVGPTSKGRKGSSWAQIRRLFEAIDGDWATDHVSSGLSSGEGLIHAVRDPISQRIKTKDKGKPRFEDTVTDPGVSDKRLLVVEPEFATVLRAMGRDGNTLSGTIRQAWDTGKLGTLVKNAPARATGAHISIIAHITRGETQRYLTRTETGNGFANRFLWVCARRSKSLPEGGLLNTVDFEPILKRMRAAIDFARRAGELHRDDDARAIWRAVYEELSEGKPGLLGAVIARAEAQVMRLATVYALLDGSAVISALHLRAALALWNYCEASARHIFGDALGDPMADDILSALRNAPDGCTRTQLRDLFGRNRSGEEIGRALAVLLEAGLVRLVRDETGGRPAERWFATRGATTETTETTEAHAGRIGRDPQAGKPEERGTTTNNAETKRKVV